MILSAIDLEALLASPALAPPDGVLPQFEEPPNQNELAFSVTTALSCVLSLCVVLRLYGRGVLERQLGIEDCKSTYLM